MLHQQGKQRVADRSHRLHGHLAFDGRLFCIVCLTDVTVGPASFADSSFAGSRQFKRGVTLQLTEPPQLQFYDRSWNIIASRSSRDRFNGFPDNPRIYEVLEGISGVCMYIPDSLFGRHPAEPALPESACIAHRMWRRHIYRPLGEGTLPTS